MCAQATSVLSHGLKDEGLSALLEKNAEGLERLQAERPVKVRACACACVFVSSHAFVLAFHLCVDIGCTRMLKLRIACSPYLSRYQLCLLTSSISVDPWWRASGWRCPSSGRRVGRTANGQHAGAEKPVFVCSVLLFSNIFSLSSDCCSTSCRVLSHD